MTAELTPGELAALQEELKRLRIENKKLGRELKYQQNLNDRNRDSAQAKDNLSRIVSAEKSKLEKYMNLLLANFPDVVLFFDGEGRVVFVSDTYLRLCRISAFGMIRGKPYYELLAPAATEDFLERADAAFHCAIAEKRTSKGEHDIDFARDGTFRHYLVEVTPMMEESGAAEGVIAFFYDMTELVQAKHDAERARELAEQSTRAKSDFLSRMSHEIRTPMNAIIGMTTIAKSSDDASRKEYCLDRIGEASRHLLGVINDILDMSKIEADKFELSSEEFDFGKMLYRVVNVINFRVEEKKQKFLIEIGDDIPQNVVADEQRLAQVIANLLSNAVKFTPEEGVITLRAKKILEEDNICTLRVEVQDTGIGISEEQRKRLFTSFEQADGSISRKFGGTGLGLAISKRIVEMMDGRIWIESELGQGASFIFEIKARKGADLAESIPGADTGEVNVSSDGVFAGKRIMIAEDVAINREIVQALIEHTEIAIDFAFDGLEAVEKFSACPEEYEMILMDVQMPNLDGYGATGRIRASGLPRAETIPIIAMTANVFREDIERCHASGMNDHIGKPIDPEELIAKIRLYLRKE